MRAIFQGNAIDNGRERRSCDPDIHVKCARNDFAVPEPRSVHSGPKKKDVAAGGRWACFLGGEAPTDGGDVGASSRGNPRRSAGATRPAVRDTQSGSDRIFRVLPGTPAPGSARRRGAHSLRNYGTTELRNCRTELLTYLDYALRMVQPNIMLWSSCARLWQWAT